jgi:farnesyl-diphosphate farnesyltransferase
VARVFKGLAAAFQTVIRDICKRMGDGMAEYIVKDVVSIADYDKYCHYVAGALSLN